MTEINVACVLWGNKYSAETVVSLYRQVKCNLTLPIKFHVFSEPDRFIAAPFNHCLLNELPDCAGWWHKMQLFDSSVISGPVLYLDLDVVVTGNLDWITQLDPVHLWGIRDFRYLWDPKWHGYNSSVMWWDTTKYDWLWQNFKQDPKFAISRFRGDQDWITQAIKQSNRRFFPDWQMASWRWQCTKGGWDHRAQKYKDPRAQTNTLGASVVVFHGAPKPWEIDCKIVHRYRNVL